MSTWRMLATNRSASQETTDRLLEASSYLMHHLDRWEDSDDAQLAPLSEELALLSRCLRVSVTFGYPGDTRLPHEEPTHQEQMETLTRAVGEQDSILAALPPGAVDRLTALVARAERARLARDVRAVSSKDAAGSRWARLEPVRQYAFQRRAQLPQLSRAAAIRQMKDEVVAAAREQGVPLTGDDPSVIATITRWFRKEGIR